MGVGVGVRVWAWGGGTFGGLLGRGLVLMVWANVSKLMNPRMYFTHSYVFSFLVSYLFVFCIHQ